MTDTARACPICRKPEDAAYRPFCSRRCADVDLQRWFTGRYAVPVVDGENGEDDTPSDTDR
ncbi:MAG TPA: DNA gyrase inhibitor YacG [Caulobacteraceae bacterium]|jgi:endogenous inhibitor of DNA gyrase (YacG/DUF329 family)|nr:DNA gyrase inhibitor YacG [Caulobacteraceae bacterium]